MSRILISLLVLAFLLGSVTNLLDLARHEMVLGLEAQYFQEELAATDQKIAHLESELGEIDLARTSFEDHYRRANDSILAEAVMPFIDANQDLNAIFGLVVRELRSGLEFAYNDTLAGSDGLGSFHPASVCKLFIAAAYCKLDLEGRLSLDSLLSTPYGPISVRRLISYMLSHSNNNYFNLLYHHLTPEGLHAELREMGIEQTVVLTSMAPAEEVPPLYDGPIKSTPRDAAIILDRICNGYFEDHTDLLVDAMVANVYVSRIPRAVAGRALVAHKTGTTFSFNNSAGITAVNDAGFVYLEGNPFMIVMLMTADGPLDLDGAEEAERSLVGSVFNLHQKRAEGVDAYLKSETTMIGLQTALNEHHEDGRALREQLTSIVAEQERLKASVQQGFVRLLFAVLALMGLMSLSLDKSWTPASGRT